MIFNNLYRNKNTVRFPDFANVIKTFVHTDTSYTTKKDGWLRYVGMGATSYVAINGIKLAQGQNTQLIPVQKGQIITLNTLDKSSAFYGCQK